METADGWSVSNLSNAATSTNDHEFGYTGDIPTQGAGGCLHITLTNSGADGTHLMFYQQVNLDKSKRYKFDFAAKAVQAMDNSWVEAYYGTVEPADGSDYGAGTNVWALGGFKFTGWANECTAATDLFDGTLQVDGCLANSQNEISFEGEGEITVFIGVKVGIWAKATTVELLFDNLSLVEVGGTTAVGSVNSQNIKLSPIPANNVLNIESATPIVSATILSVTGQQVLKTNNVDNKIDVSSLKAGIYTVQLVDEKGTKTVMKFIKK